jgi:linoleoyl-CoA desaturase
MSFKTVKFPKNTGIDFGQTLKARVAEYFKENNISTYANSYMVIKSIFMGLLYFVPFTLIMLNVFSNPWVVYSLWIVMGLGIAGIGLSIMHDASHGSYSKNPTINLILRYSMNMVGGSSFNWKIQHNMLHHSYTNVEGLDDDIAPGFILRFSPHAKHYKIHHYQHIYAWFFYGLSTISWITSKDFVQLFKFKRDGLLQKYKNFYKLVLEVFVWKLIYFAYTLVLPLLILPFSAGFIIFCFLSMHFVAGFMLTIIFQPAHVMPTSEYPLPDEEGSLENNWLIHQMLTTANFCPTSRLFSWYVGGLNFQIEHHLFPNICHIHYKKIAPLVKQTAEEFGIPYYSQKTFAKAIWEHTKMLRILGKPQVLATA